MCGIFAYLGPKKNAGHIVLDGLKSLEYRGYDSWGVAIRKKDGSIFIEKHTGKIGDAKLPDMESTIAVGHTRWATHGGVTDWNAHPHTDCHNTIVVVHNGIIENYQTLKQELLKNGHVFKSETDTEVIAHLLEEKLVKGVDSRKMISYLFKTVLKGLSAIIVYLPEENAFYAIKNSSPLVFGIDEVSNEFFLASDSAGILPHTSKIYFLEDYEVLALGPTGYEVHDAAGDKKNISFLTIDQVKESFSLGAFPHYMIKEINEQPRVIDSIANTQKQAIMHLAEKIRKAYGTYLVGCGSAYYACLAGTYLFSKIAKRHINASTGSEFMYQEDFLTEKSMIIALSQSGETIDIISPVKKAKEKKATIVALTNVLGSTLYRIADEKILLGAGPEKCVLATKSFTAKIAILYLIAYSLIGKYDEGKQHLEKAVAEVQKIIHRKEEIKTLAEVLKSKEHIYILGRGSSYPTALESTLKIKEVSYIHAEGFAGGELKHGVIALIEKGTPVIIYNPEDETYDDTLSSAHEVKARGAYVIGVSGKSNSIYDAFVPVEYCGDATIIPNVVVAQLLGYYLALTKGYDPDKPRNLAKSVTVK